MTTTTAPRLLLQRSLRSLSTNRNVSLALGVASFASAASTSPTKIAFCDDGSKDWIKKSKDGSIDWEATQDAVATQLGNSIQKAVDTGIPTQLSYGFVCGYCSGYALKKVGRIGAIIGGESCKDVWHEEPLHHSLLTIIISHMLYTHRTRIHDVTVTFVFRIHYD